MRPSVAGQPAACVLQAVMVAAKALDVPGVEPERLVAAVLADVVQDGRWRLPALAPALGTPGVACEVVRPECAPLVVDPPLRGGAPVLDVAPLL